MDEAELRKMIEQLSASGAVDALDAQEEESTRAVFAESFGAMFSDLRRPITGLRAQQRYARERPGRLVVLSQPLRRWTPHGSVSPLPFAILVTLREGAEPPPLGAFCKLEPCIAADDFAWAMVHTHEDGEHGAGMGGPYFITREMVPTRA